MRIVFFTAALTTIATAAGAQPPAQRAPAGGWLQYVAPDDAGFSSTALDSIRRFADSVRSGAVMAVYRGNVIAAWGDVTRELEAHSVRKSLLSALYGIAVAEGKVDLDRTLGDLGIDDIHRLTATEKDARIRDLIAARSGVFLPAAYGGDQDASRPARGSHAPGTHWFYNNWDFNTAGVVYEQLTGEKLYDSFARRIAAPLGMQDWSADDGFLVLEPTRSRYPAHTFRISTRDLARFGLLYLKGGQWNGRRIVPADWVRQSTQPISQLPDGQGYGYMWWTQKAGTLPERYATLNRHDLFLARGTGGQAVFVIPALDLVVVHRGDTDHGRNVSGRAVWTIVEGIAAAKKGEPRSRPALEPLKAIPFASQLAPVAKRKYMAIDSSAAAALLGEYVFGPEAIGRVFTHGGRLFMFMPGEGEAELFRLAPREYTVRVVSGVSIVFEPDEGPVTGMTVRLGENTMRAKRR